MSRRSAVPRTTAKRTSKDDPDPDPEPPAAPPIIILSKNGKTPTAPHSQPHRQATSSLVSQDSSTPSTRSRYNFRARKDTRSTVVGKEPEPDPFPAAPPVIILSNKRPASASPPRSPPSIQTTTGIPPSPASNPSSTTSASPIAHTPHTPAFPTPAIDIPNTAPAVLYSTLPLPPEDTVTYHKHTMGSKVTKLAPSGGKLQPSLEKQDKAEMKEPSNYYSHRSKSMRRKGGKTGATGDAGGTGGGAGGGVGGAV